MDILTVLFFLLGLTISWLPLTLLLFSTLAISICLTAEEIEANRLQFEEQMANNRTRTIRQQQRQYPLPEPPAHASLPLHIPPGTSLHDISDLTRTLLLQVQQQQQRTPTQGHNSNTIPTTDDTPSWPRTLAIPWPSLTKFRLFMLNATTFTSRPRMTQDSRQSRHWMITHSWQNWLKG